LAKSKQVIFGKGVVSLTQVFEKQNQRFSDFNKLNEIILRDCFEWWQIGFTTHPICLFGLHTTWLDIVLFRQDYHSGTMYQCALGITVSYYIHLHS
jgi:hypothetical protein